MKVLLVYSPAPRVVREWPMELPDRSSAAQAMKSSGIFESFPDLQSSGLLLGLWGQRIASNHTLQQGDRLEVYRRLLVDPKVARRERFKRQGSKSAGLFAGIRAGGKAGY